LVLIRQGGPRRELGTGVQNRPVVKINFDNGYSHNVLENQLSFTIGRSQGCNLVVSSNFVSRTHCAIDVVDDEIHIVDHSSNGTFIDDYFLKNESAALEHRIHLLFGDEFILTITPYGATGDLLEGATGDDDGQSKTKTISHGVSIVDIRATLDAGVTTQTVDSDRLGLAINGAARIERVQAGNIEERGEDWASLRTRNRCILTADMKAAMRLTERAMCQHIGTGKLKGFSDTLHDIYQLPMEDEL
jgi:pSer/pThr/pTyr-binding forkhead associated (FHA) protein